LGLTSVHTGQKHIVNVTAMEGRFNRFKQASRHPHTNMAKAALNMLTHTAATELAKDGIYLNAVDTGWVTDEDPAPPCKARAVSSTVTTKVSPKRSSKPSR